MEEQKKTNGQFWASDWKDEGRRGRWRRQKINGPSIFITKTYQILEKGLYSDMISWNQQGTNFTILDVQRFQQQILPIYFRHRNFSSFVRQLNMYDFHKIRNQQNKNIFQHKEFRRDAKFLLRNIKRKGCTKKPNEQVDDASYQPQTPFEQEEYVEEKHQSLRPTVAMIQKQSYIDICRISQTPKKIKLIEDFIDSLPDIVESQLEVKQLIRQLKNDSKYNCLNSKQDIRKIVKKIRRDKMKKQKKQDGLQELSIQQQIMVHNVDDRQLKNPTLAILSSENYIPKTIPLLCSLVLIQDMIYFKN